MIIDTVRTNNKDVLSMMWNGHLLYEMPPIVDDNPFPREYTWEYNEATGDYPNASDNIECFDFTRTLVNASSTRKTREVIVPDKQGGYAYCVYPNSGRGATMRFKFTLPAHTSVRIDGLVGGYNGGFTTTVNSKVYVSTTTGTTGLVLSLYDALPKSYTGKWYDSGFDSSKLTAVSGTLTNDADTDQEYNMIFYNYNEQSMVTNYWFGMFVKYIKFTRL